MAAHRVRGVGDRGGFRNRIENAKRLTFPQLIRALRDANTTGSMDGRAFGAHPTRTFGDRVSMPTAGQVVTFGSLAVVIVCCELVIAGVSTFQYSIT
jgi:energy-coupling factor transporter transmembrane protein EcfT